MRVRPAQPLKKRVIYTENIIQCPGIYGKQKVFMCPFKK